jgi:succinate-semialdehyde dehydrogenase/glutarate-semialdehyde dehydrogenase
MVWINDHSYSHGAMQTSWGGVKDSGLGRSHSKFGLYECSNVKHIGYEAGLTRDFWWQPYDDDLGTALRSSARILYGPGATGRRGLREGGDPLTKRGAQLLREGR